MLDITKNNQRKLKSIQEGMGKKLLDVTQRQENNMDKETKA